MSEDGSAPQYRKKLIEVDIPLDAINHESSREKKLTHGHPSTLHRWWARRPLAACRAVIFASLVDDPSECTEEYPTEADQLAKREDLHKIIEDLVKWETTDPSSSSAATTLRKARFEIARSVARNNGDRLPSNHIEAEAYLSQDGTAPNIHDPFCGGGSVPYEAQRLGLNALASDQNPIAVLITKALVQLPVPFMDEPPINPDANPLGIKHPKSRGDKVVPWRGASGLADDLRYYGREIIERVRDKIGKWYPDLKLPDGRSATTTAWLWANTVACNDLLCGYQIPLVKTWVVTSNGTKWWVKPIKEADNRTYSFRVQDTDSGVPTQPTVRQKRAVCIACDKPISFDYIRDQASQGRMKQTLLAIVAHNGSARYVSAPTYQHSKAASRALAGYFPEGLLPNNALGFSVQNYGMTGWASLFTPRQLAGLTTLSREIEVIADEMIASDIDREYVKAVKTYLAFALGRVAESNNRLTRWVNSSDFVAGVFGRQTINMVWDFAEPNIFSNRTQNWMAQIDWIARVLERMPSAKPKAVVELRDASNQTQEDKCSVFVTDPPYYDNIGYADLSDFFYVWHRPLLKDHYEGQFTGIAVPKHNQMVAAPIFDDPRGHFTGMMSQALNNMRESCSDVFPSSMFYAYKQQEEQSAGRSSTGWDTMLESLVNAGFMIVGTWPMRTEHSGRLRSQNSNALATSVLLVIRPRPSDAPVASRRQFVGELENRLPVALVQLTRYNHIGPLDLEQAAIGPGMEVYSKYARVETNSGKRVAVRDALQQINQVVADYINREESELSSELDEPTQFCLSWTRVHGFDKGASGDADGLAVAKAVGINSLQEDDSLVISHRGEFRVVHHNEFSPEQRGMAVSQATTVWEGCMRMAYHFGHKDGDRVAGAADIYRLMGPANGAKVERLARILFDGFNRRKEPSNSIAYNDLVASWSDIEKEALKPIGRELGA